MITTMTSSTWTALPERGKPEKRFGPKYPNNHSTSRITIIQVSMRSVLLRDSFYNSSYNKHSPTASISRGVFVSVTWGRQLKASSELDSTEFLFPGNSKNGRDAGKPKADRIRVFHAVLARIEFAGCIKQIQVGRDRNHQQRIALKLLNGNCLIMV